MLGVDQVHIERYWFKSTEIAQHSWDTMDPTWILQFQLPFLDESEIRTQSSEAAESLP